MSVEDSNSDLQAQRDADSRVDMWSCIALVMLAWGAALFWVSGL